MLTSKNFAHIVHVEKINSRHAPNYTNAGEGLGFYIEIESGIASSDPQFDVEARAAVLEKSGQIARLLNEALGVNDITIEGKGKANDPSLSGNPRVRISTASRNLTVETVSKALLQEGFTLES